MDSANRRRSHIKHAVYDRDEARERLLLLAAFVARPDGGAVAVAVPGPGHLTLSVCLWPDGSISYATGKYKSVNAIAWFSRLTPCLREAGFGAMHSLTASSESRRSDRR